MRGISDGRANWIMGQEKRAIIRSVSGALAHAELPPLDRVTISIVASQIGALRKGGWPLEEIHNALRDLALAWDEKRGHNRVLHLAARVRALDYDRERRKHIARMKTDREIARNVRAIKNMRFIGGRSHPNEHDFQRGLTPGSCEVCSGPEGVHVRPGVSLEA